MCAGRPGSLFRPRFRGELRRGARGGRPQRIRQNLVAAADCGPAGPRGRGHRARRRRRRADAGRAIALSRPSRCAEAGAQRVGKLEVLAGFSRRDDVGPGRKPRYCRARPCRAFAGRLFVRGTAAQAFDCPSAHRAAAGLAARRTDQCARHRRAKAVLDPDGGSSGARRPDRRRHPHAARNCRAVVAHRRCLVRALSALIRRDIRIALRVGGGALIGVLFFLTVVVLMPFAIGPDLALLARLGPAILWLGALLASLLTLDRLFTADHDDGSLDLITMSRTPLELSCAAKALAHWLAAGLPLILATPVLGLLLNLDVSATAAVALTLLAGTPALTFTGMIGAALAVTLHRGGLLLAVLVLPLSIPVLIFGVAASEAAITGPLSFGAPFSILCALSLVSFVIGPFAAAASLRQGLD